MINKINNKIISNLNLVIEIILLLYIFLLMYRGEIEFSIQIALITGYIWMNHNDQREIWRLLKSYQEQNNLSREFIMKVNNLHNLKTDEDKEYRNILDWYNKESTKLKRKGW